MHFSCISKWPYVQMVVRPNGRKSKWPYVQMAVTTQQYAHCLFPRLVLVHFPCPLGSCCQTTSHTASGGDRRSSAQNPHDKNPTAMSVRMVVPPNCSNHSAVCLLPTPEVDAVHFPCPLGSCCQTTSHTARGGYRRSSAQNPHHKNPTANPDGGTTQLQ